MKVNIWILLSIPVLLSGCLYGQCLEGPCALEREKIIQSIKAYIEYWDKPGMTAEKRLEDWVACGGNKDGNFVLDRRKMLPNEDPSAFRTKSEFHFQRCMIRGGYRYTGDCTSEYMKARPLCGAP